MLRMGGFLHKAYQTLLSALQQQEHNTTIASLPCNAARNREGAPLASAPGRVKLQLVMEELGSDYINAR